MINIVMGCSFHMHANGTPQMCMSGMPSAMLTKPFATPLEDFIAIDALAPLNLLVTEINQVALDNKRYSILDLYMKNTHDQNFSNMKS